MSTETVQDVKVEETVPSATDMLSEAISETPGEGYTPLFEETPSVEALSGDVPDEKPAEQAPPAESKEAETKTEEPPAPSAEAKATEESKAEEPPPAVPEPEKPPKGYVPLNALHEERMKRQEATQKIQDLQAELDTLRAAPPKPADLPRVDPDFKVLSKKEFEELVETDPSEAIKYRADLDDYHRAVAAQAEQRRIETQHREVESAQVQRSHEALMAKLPDLFVPESELPGKLTAFASEHGLKETYLSVLSDPRTKVIPFGAKEPVLLGEGASQLVEMIHGSFVKAGTTDLNALRASIRAELEPELRKAITAEVMTKIKTDSLSASAPRSIGDIPTAGSTEIDPKTVTEDDFRRMTPEEKKRVLGG